MIRLLLLTTLIFSTLFLFYVPTGKVGFLFSDVILNTDTYVYFLFEHLILVILAVCVYLATKDKLVLMYLILQGIDTIDYVLTYGEPWFDSKVFTWNTIKVCVFGLAMIYDKYGR